MKPIPALILVAAIAAPVAPAFAQDAPDHHLQG